LIRKLQPQWQDRDSVKNVIGEERWKNNPEPKNNYAEKRRALEEETRDVTDAMLVIKPLKFAA
jgi:hypothetical protein